MTAAASRALTILLRTILVGAALYVVAFSVWPALFGEAGLNLGSGKVPSTTQTSMALPVTPAAEFQHELAAASGKHESMFPWSNTSNGTKDAATGLPPVQLRPDPAMALNLLDPTWHDRVDFALPLLIKDALTLGVIALLWGAASSAHTLTPLATISSQRLMWIAGLVGVGGTAYQLVRNMTWGRIVDRSAAHKIVMADWSFSYLPIALGCAGLVLAIVLKRILAIPNDRS